MKNNFILFYFLFLFCFCSCEKAEKPDLPPKSGTYLSSYLTKFQTIEIEPIRNGKSFYVQFHLIGEYAIYNSPLFRQISESYKDTGYSDYPLPTSIPALSDSIKSIHIYTLKDFNETYKKNDKIDDLVKIEYKSFYEFIESHYQNDSGIDNFIFLNDFNRKTTKLFFPGFYFHFIELPSVPGIYTLKIEVETYSDFIESQFNININ